MAVYFNATKDIVKGSRNSRSPVTLFIIVCREINCFLQTYPHIILPILIIAIIPPQIHNHPGRWVSGNSLITDASTKTRSATVSSWLPNLLLLFVFLAMVPSIISLKPQRRYVISNFRENAGKNSNKILPKIRQPVSIFAICFVICSPTNPNLTFGSLYHIWRLHATHSELDRVEANSPKAKRDSCAFPLTQGQACANILLLMSCFGDEREK